MEEWCVHIVHLVPHKIWFENVHAFKCPARIHPRLDTRGNCHRQHLASGALPQLEHLSVAALVMEYPHAARLFFLILRPPPYSAS